MGRARSEEISYYIDTFFDRVEKLKSWWRHRPWETKVRIKGTISALSLGLAYIFYSGSWSSLSDFGKAGLVLYTLIALALFASALLEVLNLNTFKY